nr:MAG TPA: hypothetical protein [Caudoviricetes sp.]
MISHFSCLLSCCSSSKMCVEYVSLDFLKQHNYTSKPLLYLAFSVFSKN